MQRATWRRLGLGIVLALVALGLVLPSAEAQRPAGKLREKFQTGDTIEIPANAIVAHDLYLAGGTVRVAGSIDGDLFVGGGTVDISGPVSGDVFVGGGTVTISGLIGRHLRVAGGDVTVSGPVQLDVLAGAGNLNLASGSRVGGDLIFAVDEMRLAGTVAGGVLGSATKYTKTGTVTGAEDVTINEPRPERPAPTLRSQAAEQFRRFAGIVLVGQLLLWLLPWLMQSGAMRLRERPLPSLGFGALGFVGFFGAFLALIVGMIVLGIPLGVLGLFELIGTMVFGGLLASAVLTYVFVVVLTFVAAGVVGLALGQIGLERFDGSRARSSTLALILGVLVVVLVTAIPVVGWLVGAVVALLGMGALILSFRQRGRTPTPPVPPAAPAPSDEPMPPAAEPA